MSNVELSCMSSVHAKETPCMQVAERFTAISGGTATCQVCSDGQCVWKNRASSLLTVADPRKPANELVSQFFRGHQVLIANSDATGSMVLEEHVMASSPKNTV